MALSPLDSSVALVVIDLQKGIVSMPTLHSIEPIIDRAASLAREFRERGLPVVLVNVTGGAPGRTSATRPAFTPPPDWTELVPQLEPSAGDHLVSKQRWGAFLGTDLDSYLRGKGVTQIVLLGVATSIGVESTARSAYDLGYNLVLVLDAMTDRSAEAHANSIERILPRLGEVATTDEVLAALAPSAT